MNNIEYAAALRQVADFYEANPTMRQPITVLHIYTWDRKNFFQAVADLAKGGRVTKIADDSTEPGARFRALRDFGGIGVEISTPRSTVCRLVTPAVYDCPDSMPEEALAAAPETPETQAPVAAQPVYQELA